MTPKFKIGDLVEHRHAEGGRLEHLKKNGIPLGLGVVQGASSPLGPHNYYKIYWAWGEEGYNFWRWSEDNLILINRID